MSLHSRHTMQLDRLLWLPFVVIRGIINVFPAAKPREKGPLVIIKLYGMGSLIRLQSVLDDYNIPSDDIYLVTLPGLEPTANWLRKNTLLLTAHTLWQLPWAFWKTVREIRRLKPKAIIDLERSSNGVGILRVMSRSKSKEISFRITPGDRVGHNGKEISLHHKPVTQAIAEALGDLGYSRLNRGEGQKIQLDNTLMVNLNASDYMPQRKYPASHFVQFIRLWSEKHPDARIVLTGSSKERDYVQKVADQLEGVQVENRAGDWNLEEFCQELSRCALLVTNDSGPMHIAHYLGAPALVIWGPTHPKYVGYSDSDRLKNLWSEKSCSPCFEHPRSKIAVSCQGRVDCLQEILPADVLREAELLWKPHTQISIRFPKLSEAKQEEATL